MQRPTLADLFSEATRRHVSWNLAETPFAAGEFRCGLVLLARGVPLRLLALPVATYSESRLPGGLAEEPMPVTWFEIAGPRGLDAHDARRLTDLCVEARLTELARIARFPDWLGYLGVILYVYGIQGFKDHHLRISQEWAIQFIAMGGNPATWEPFTHEESMTWRDLENAERERLGAR
jgi:hypothetical protein